MYARIFKDMIIVASSEKPFPRAPKGSIRRKATLEAYDTEIQALCVRACLAVTKILTLCNSYRTSESKAAIDCVPLPSSWKLSDICHWIEQLGNVNRAGRSLDLNTDLFEQGFDRYVIFVSLRSGHP